MLLQIRASVRFYLVGDRKVLWDSQIMHAGDSAVSFNVELKDIKKLGFLVTDAGDGIEQDYADWIDVSITYKGKSPVVVPAYSGRALPVDTTTTSRTTDQWTKSLRCSARFTIYLQNSMYRR